MIITAHAYARAGLVGNPSDGYFGKTISFVIRQYAATVRLWESPNFEILPTHGDFAKYDSVHAYLRDQKLYGYYGGQRLMKAAVKRFFDYCDEHDCTFGDGVHEKNFTLQFETNIPRLVGMSGSSGIIVATMRALCEFYNVQIPKPQFATLVMRTETEELSITAGLQDRVIQTYGGMVYMDFDRKLMERGYGDYEELKPEPAPPLYVAFDAERAEVSDVTHRNLRAAYNRGERDVVEAMETYRGLTDRGKAALLSANWDELHKVMNENFDLRKTIMPIAKENQRMIDVARAAGASAKFAGSGGAITGVYHGEEQYRKLQAAMAEINCTVLKPKIWE